MGDLSNKDDFHKYIDILQLNIQRMASNSRYCKAWGISLSSAIVFFAFKEKINNCLYIVYLVALLFWFLDSFYLYLERSFIIIFESKIKLYKRGDLTIDEVYDFNMPKGGKRLFETLKTMFTSYSTLPFYSSIIIFVFILLYNR